MRLTKYSYYALRVLLYLQSHPGRLSTIGEIADRNEVSKAHLMKVVHRLGRVGFIETVRGRGGGLCIARSAEKIPLGYLLRMTETAFKSIDPQMRGQALDSVASSAILGEILDQCRSAQLAVLDRFTLADLCPNDGQTAQHRHTSRKAHLNIAVSPIGSVQARSPRNAEPQRAIAA